MNNLQFELEAVKNIPAELLLRYSSHFFNRLDDMHGEYYDKSWVKRIYGPKAEAGWRTVSEQLSLNSIRLHLTGEITLAAPATDDNGNSSWICWDNDSETNYLRRINKVLEAINIAAYFEGRRRGREGHLWVFFDDCIPREDFQLFDREIRAHAGLKHDDLEFFPKGSGYSQIRLPLGVNLKPEANFARSWFEGVERDLISQMEWLVELPYSDILTVINIVDALKEENPQMLKPLKRRRAGSTINAEDAYAALNPVLAHDGKSYKCKCPKCGHRRAYFYSSGSLLCNRIDSCGFKTSIQEWLTKRPTPI